ncbi:hypothetical protein [Grimontia marina]|uniref:Uncharacterized protein n=1 Tax=Grimontia marina TaxID=646534 RepID=A0A128FKL8_9GAMM|nr:hypothetical protein [Grimontia marina]CZF86995.1 hypothetical protein GMA8713_05036 [Grimontia marina]
MIFSNLLRVLTLAILSLAIISFGLHFYDPATGKGEGFSPFVSYVTVYTPFIVGIFFVFLFVLDVYRLIKSRNKREFYWLLWDVTAFSIYIAATLSVLIDSIDKSGMV